MKKLPAAEVIERFGGIRPIAKALEITPSTVQGWKKRGVIPENRFDAVIAAAFEFDVEIKDLVEAALASAETVTPLAAVETSFEEKSTTAKPSRKENPLQSDGDRRQTDRRKSDRRKVQDPNYTGAERRVGSRRQGLDRRQIKEIRRAKRAFIERSMITTAFLFVLIGVPAIILLAPEFVQMQKSSSRVEYLEYELQNLNNQVYGLKRNQGSIAKMVSNRSHQPEQAGQQNWKAPEQIVRRIESLEQNLEGLNGNLNNTLSMLKKMGAMQKTSGGKLVLTESLDEIRGVVASLEGDMNKLNMAVDDARQGNEALAMIFKDVSRQDAGAAAMLLALSQLREMVSGDRTPFSKDLEMVRALVGGQPEMQEALASLAPYAEIGLLSQDILKTEFKALAGDIVLAQLRGEDMSIKERALKRMNNLVRVRRRTEVKGQTTEAIVARAQYYLDQGNIRKAVIELQTLEAEPKAVAQPWLNAAQARVVADRVTQKISKIVLEKISVGRQDTTQNIDDILYSEGSYGRSAVPVQERVK